jgi:hypothetical protein
MRLRRLRRTETAEVGRVGGGENLKGGWRRRRLKKREGIRCKEGFGRKGSARARTRRETIFCR